jgi:hypothetical protein
MTTPYKQPILAPFTDSWVEDQLYDMCLKCKVWFPDNKRHFCSQPTTTPISPPVAHLQPQVAVPVQPTPVLTNSHTQDLPAKTTPGSTRLWLTGMAYEPCFSCTNCVLTPAGIHHCLSKPTAPLCTNHSPGK